MLVFIHTSDVSHKIKRERENNMEKPKMHPFFAKKKLLGLPLNGKTTLGIVGSRLFDDELQFSKHMERAVAAWGKPDRVVTGCARGADQLGREWAKANGVELVVHRAEWNKYGRAAGIMRNADIVKMATHLLAFPSERGSGTQNSMSRMRERAEKQGVGEQSVMRVHWVHCQRRDPLPVQLVSTK